MKGFTKLLTVALTATVVLPFLRGVPVHAASDIRIDAAHFPDANFRAVISGHDYDADLNGYLSETERANVYNIHCENSNIYSIKGVEYFGELQGLWCLNNHISSWDLSGNPHLKGIWCSKNDFTSLDFSQNKELEWVYCFDCKLKSLNISGNPEMAYVECNNNPNLTKLDLRQNGKLENLFCSDCGLTSLDLSNNPLLCELDAFNNNLKSIDFSNNKNLKRLDIWNNPNLGNVNVSMLTGLEFYNCAKTGATVVDVSKNTQLQMLVCSYNEYLKSINLTNNPRLCQLHLDCDWRLTSLDLSHNPKLYYLQAFGLRGISTLDISNNPKLIKTYKEGVYKNEPQLGECHSYTINYGGSGDYFDNLLHCLVVDNSVKIKTTGGSSSNVHDSYINTNDGHSNYEQFATREEAIQLLYELAGKPAVSGKSRFTDVPSTASYAKAIKWGQDNNICFGYPDISSDTFGVGQLISRQDFALMAHRYADYLKLGTAFDYGRTDWFDDFYDIDFYAWGAFTWSIQWGILKTSNNRCYPHGRLTRAELQAGAKQIFNMDEGAAYSSIVNANGTKVAITSQPKDFAGGIGETARFYVEASGSTLTYQWQVYKDGAWKNTSLPGSRSSTLSVEVLSSRDGMRFRCIVTGGNGSAVTSDSAKLSVLSLDITKQPSNYTGAVGETAIFKVEAAGTNLTYQWQVYKDGNWKNTSLPGNDTAELNVDLISSRNGMKFRCLIKSGTGASAISNTATLNVSTLEITSQPQDYSGYEGETAIFKVKAEGSNLTYQWQVYKNDAWKNTSLSGNNTDTLNVELLDSRDDMQFRCVVKSSDGGKVISDAATLTVLVKSVEIVNQPENITAHEGETAYFEVEAEGEGLTYQWQVYKNGAWKNTSLPGNTSSILEVGILASRNGMRFRCVITDAYGNKVTTDDCFIKVI